MGAKVFDPILVDGTKIPENSSKTPSQRIDEFEEKIKNAAKLFASSAPKEFKPLA